MDYYSKRKMAVNEILSLVKYLQKNKDTTIKISTITRQLQEKYGFSENIVMKLLDPYVEDKIIEIENREIYAATKEVAEINNG